MSGVAAVVNLDGSPVPPSEIERMVNVLRQYGPDRQKTLIRNNAAFAACLHYLTPEDLFERQPLPIVDRFVILFDGRIDNRGELAEALGLSSSELASMPDSGLFSLGLQRWGEHAFGRILGVFAIIVADLQSGALICARDQMGLRVLHYHRSAKHFAIATNPDVLFALSWVPRTLNLDMVGDTLVDRGLNGETTYYQDIYRVLPGCFVRLDGSSLSKHRYWDPKDIPDVRFKNDQDYVEAFREHLDAAVKARLRARRPPCSTITGGLDSSSISVIAGDMLAAVGAKLDTFTAVPEEGVIKEEVRGRFFDERPYVRKIAERNPNIVPHFIPPSKGSILEKMAKQIRVGGAPSGGALNSLWVMDIAAAAQSMGHEVMLSGEAGNVIMSYTGWKLFPELVRTGRWAQLIRELRHSGYRWKYLLRTRTIAPFIPPWLFSRYKKWRRGGRPPWHYYSAIDPDFAARSGVIDRAAQEHWPFDAPPPRSGRSDRIRSFDGYCETADWFARLRAIYGLDVRMPAFDQRLVEFCIGIPEDQYLDNGCDRWLIRRAMHGRLPETVLLNRNAGTSSADWFPRLTRERRQISEELKRLETSPVVASVIDTQKLASILDGWPDCEPREYSGEADLLFWALPQALESAFFIEFVTGTNLGR